MECCKNPRVVIILLNWNGWEDTIECLESLYHIKYDNYHVIVIDNDSKDDSIQKIKDYCLGKLSISSGFVTYDRSNKPIKMYEYSGFESESGKGVEIELTDAGPNTLILIKNEKNLGFAGGNNTGIRFALHYLLPDYVLLLNNDTVVDSLFLNELVNASETDNSIGVCSGKIMYYNFNGRSDIIQTTGGFINWMRFPGYFFYTYKEQETHKHDSGVNYCDWVSGAMFMMRIGDIPIKYLNEYYDFGSEDVDFCIRVKESGYNVASVLSSKIWHKDGMSRNKKFKSKLSVTLNSYKMNLKFLRRNNRLFYAYLPLYTLQISFFLIYMVFKMVIK